MTRVMCEILIMNDSCCDYSSPRGRLNYVLGLILVFCLGMIFPFTLPSGYFNILSIF